jgi:arylsulfatase A-like enzyme/Tfp pilus assembly protein PilF
MIAQIETIPPRTRNSSQRGAAPYKGPCPPHRWAECPSRRRTPLLSVCGIFKNIGRNLILALPFGWCQASAGLAFQPAPLNLTLGYMPRSAIQGLWLAVLIVTFGRLASAANLPNIIIITLDSVRADRVGAMGAKSGQTPSLDALAKESIVFNHAYAQSPSTVASHATILTGTYPQTHQAGELGAPLPATVPYLPDLLHAHGYHTAAFVGSVLLDPRNGFASGFDRGFDVYDAGFHQVSTEKAGESTQRSADQVITRATKWLTANSSGPFFLWVHLFDAHAPYLTSYDRAVSKDDAALGKLMTVLRAEKVYNETVVVVTADHGESLGAHGENTHGIFLYEETIHVPLLLRLPQPQVLAREVKGRVRLLDLAPSLLEAAGIAVPSQMQGQSLLRIARTNPDTDLPVYSRSDFPHDAFGWSTLESWRAGKYLYVRAPKPELYDLNADPGGTHNLAQSSKATLDTMASQLASFAGHVNGAANSAALSSSEMQKLASLGYVGLQKSNSAVAAAIGTDPKDTVAVSNQVIQALLNVTLGKPLQAIPILQQAAISQPNAYLPRYALGLALNLQQQYAKAIEHLRKAIELQPDSGWAHYEMGACLVKTGDFKTGVVHLELASSRLPEFRDAHVLLAQVYEHMGQTKEAQMEKDKAARL